MKVRLIKDFDLEIWLFQGTILSDCILADNHYIGMFNTKLGNFVVSVPENYCVVVEEN